MLSPIPNQWQLLLFFFFPRRALSHSDVLFQLKGVDDSIATIGVGLKCME